MYGPDGTSTHPVRPSQTFGRGSVGGAAAGSRAGPSTEAGPSIARAGHGLGAVHGPGQATPAAEPSLGPRVSQEQVGSAAAGPSRPSSSSAADAHASTDPAGESDTPLAPDAPRSGTPTSHTPGTSSGRARPRAPYIHQRGVRPRQETLDRCGWQREQHTRCTRLVGQFFYECGIPFAVADTWVFRELCLQIAAVDATWRPPRREVLRGRMLCQEEETITRELSSIRSAWET